MTTRVTIWGTAGRIFADRQEVQVYLRDTATAPAGYEPGWNIRYTTELTEPVGFYLRGEEYSAQIDHFVDRIREGRLDGLNSFASAAATDRVIAMMLADAERGASTPWRIPRTSIPPREAAAAGDSCGSSPSRPQSGQPARSAKGCVMDRLLFGDNQFFGVNHMSEEKARAQAMRFQ